MISILPAAAFFVFLYWCLRRHPWAMVSMSFILLGFVLRTLGIVYLDLFGPIFAIELQYDVGGGTAAPLFVACVMLVVAIGVWLQSRIRLDEGKIRHTLLGRPESWLSGLVLSLAWLWLGLCYGEMVASGHIPLFEGMDRLDYEQLYGRFFYANMYDYSFLYSAVLGYFFIRKRIRDGDFDDRFLYAVVALLLFFALTGNRFSILYITGSFFALPAASVILLIRKRMRLPQPVRTGRMHKIMTDPASLKVVLGAGVLVVAALVLNNFFNVRYTAFSGEAEEVLFQRIFVQPVQLYAVTWENMATGSAPDSNLAWDLMFGNPIDATRNTGIQLMMVLALGEQRATEIIDSESQFAGGYPEVLIELFGLTFAFVPMIVAALAIGLLYQQVMKAVIYGRFVTFFAGVYVLYGVSLLYIGGMLNFLMPWTFWAKTALFVAGMLLEPMFIRPPKRDATTTPLGLSQLPSSVPS